MTGPVHSLISEWNPVILLLTDPGSWAAALLFTNSVSSTGLAGFDTFQRLPSGRCDQYVNAVTQNNVFKTKYLFNRRNIAFRGKRVKTTKDSWDLTHLS